MAYTGPDDKSLPAAVLAVKDRPKRARWVAIWNNVIKKTGDNRRALATANAVLMTKRQALLSGTLKAAALCLPETSRPFVLLSAVGTEKVFRKGVLPRGNFKHPLTGRDLSYPEEIQLSAIESSNRYIRNGNQCAFQDGHNDSARNTMGWWKPEFGMDGDEVSGNVGVSLSADQEKVEKGAIKYVSPMLLSYWMDANENEYENVMVHVCATPRPVMPSQKPFEKVELSLGGETRTFNVMEYFPCQSGGNGRKKMDKTKLITLLGLSSDSTEEQIEAAIASLNEGKSKPEASSALAASASLVTKLSATVNGLEALVKTQGEKMKLLEKSGAETFIGGFQSEATLLGLPFTKDEVDQLSAVYDASPGTAKMLATAKMDNIKLRIAARGGSTATALSATSGQNTAEMDKKKNVAENMAYKKAMEGNGYCVTLSADGTELISCKKPGEK